MDGLVLISPGSVCFSVGTFHIYFYGIVMALAIFVGILIANNLSNNLEKSERDIFIDLAPLLVVSGLIGARFWYCLVNFKEYIYLPLSILNLRTGGLSIHGAILGGFVALLLYAKYRKLNLLSLSDYAVVGLSFGQAIGRWGNFFNNEAFGLPYDGFIKLYIPYVSRPVLLKEYEYFHPAFLYESMLDFLLGMLLLIMVKRLKNRKHGLVTLVYLALYSALRFFIELIRVDSNLYFFNLPFPAIVSLLVFGVSVFFIIFRLTKLNN